MKIISLNIVNFTIENNWREKGKILSTYTNRLFLRGYLNQDCIQASYRIINKIMWYCFPSKHNTCNTYNFFLLQVIIDSLQYLSNVVLNGNTYQKTSVIIRYLFCVGKNVQRYTSIATRLTLHQKYLKVEFRNTFFDFSFNIKEIQTLLCFDIKMCQCYKYC